MQKQNNGVAPKITMEMINQNIVREDYFTADDGIIANKMGVMPNASHRLLTFCVLVLKNGFTVTGESACASPENFNEEMGKKIAREKAIEKMWPLMGYELKTQLALLNSVAPAKTGPFPAIPGGNHFISLDFQTYVGTKVIHAAPMTRWDYNQFRGWAVPANENPDDEGYLVQYTDGGAPNVEGIPGYVSWSPKEVFEKAYKTGVVIKQTTFVDRLLAEFSELNDRVTKLTAFLGSEGFKQLDVEDQNDLGHQHGVMLLYRNVLEKRLNRFAQ